MKNDDPPSELAQQLARQVVVKVETREATAEWILANKPKLARERFGQVVAGIIVAVGSTFIAAEHWQPNDPLAWLIVGLAIVAVMASGVRIAIELNLIRHWVK